MKHPGSFQQTFTAYWQEAPGGKKRLVYEKEQILQKIEGGYQDIKQVAGKLSPGLH